MLLLCTIVFLFCLITVGYSEDSTDIKCIPLKDCPYAMNMVYTQKYASTTIEFLKISDCGYSKTDGPLIQCPTSSPLTSGPQSNGFDCITWTGKKGICKDVNDCSTISNTFITMKDFKVCKQSDDKEAFKMKICCFEPDQKGFSMQPPKGYSPQLIPIEDSTLQEFSEPAAVEIISNNLNQYDSSIYHPNIQTTSTAPHDINQQDTKVVYQDFLDDLNQQVGESNNLNFAIINEAKKSTPINSSSSEIPNSQENGSYQNDSKNFPNNMIVPQKPVTRQSKINFPDSSDKTIKKNSDNEKAEKVSLTMMFPEDSQENTKFKNETLESPLVKEKHRLNKHLTTRILQYNNGPSSTKLKTTKRMKRELKDELVMSVKLVNKHQPAKLRPLTLTPENSENFQTEESLNGQNGHSTVHRERSDKLENPKIVSQHAKLRPLTHTAEIVTDTVKPKGIHGHSKVRSNGSEKSTNLGITKIVPPSTLITENPEILKDKVNPNRSNEHSVVLQKISDTIINLDSHNNVSEQAKLRPLTLTAKNSEIGKNSVTPNGNTEHSIVLGEKSHKVNNLVANNSNPKQAKLRPLSLIAENSEIVKNVNENDEYSLVRGKKLDKAMHLELHKSNPHQAKLRPLNITSANSEIVEDTVSPNGSNDHSTIFRENSTTVVNLEPNKNDPKQVKLRPVTVTAENSEIAKDAVSANKRNEYSIVLGENSDTVMHLVEPHKTDPSQAKLRPLNITAENSEIVEDTVNPNGSNEHSMVFREMSDTTINLEPNKSDPQQAKLRPLTLTENSEIDKNTELRNEKNRHLIVGVKKSRKSKNLDPYKIISRHAKLRTLTFPAENSEFVKNIKHINGCNGNSIVGGIKSSKSRNLERQKLVPQHAKFLTAENSEFVKDTVSPNGSKKRSIFLGEKSDTAINLRPYKMIRQKAKLRALTLTAQNSGRIKDTVSPNRSNKRSIVLRKKSDTAMNSEIPKIVPRYSILGPTNLLPENSDVKIKRISRRRRAIRNSNGKYSKNLDFDDSNNSHKKYVYPKRLSGNFHKPPYSPKPYFPLKHFYVKHDVDMIIKYNFPSFNKPRFNGSSRDDKFACGREGRRNRNRIIGGIPVALGEYPWMVLFQYINNNSIINGCGGSLINSRYILTAAHCVDNEVLKLQKIKLFRIILGEFDTSRDPVCISSPELMGCTETSRIYGISNVVLTHPHFNQVNAVNDIALVKVDREVIFSDYIKPICLPPSDFKHDNESIIIAGWGRTEPETYNEVLNNSILPIVDKEVCKRLGITLTKGQICVGLGNGIDTCVGDSGGALMAQRMYNVEVVTYLYGIISYGFGSTTCGKALSVNTFVPFYLEWIYSKLASAD